jgi:hypothetical protein
MNNWHLILIENESFHERYVRNEKNNSEFLTFILNNLSLSEDVHKLFNGNCDFRFVYDNASKMDNPNINENVFYKKLNYNNTILDKKHFSEKAENLKDLFCIFKENKWYILSHKFSSKTSHSLSNSYIIKEWEDRILPLEFFIEAKKFVNMYSDFNMFAYKCKPLLKELYTTHFINSNELISQKHSWWNNYVLDDSETNGESVLFQKLRIEIEKEGLENKLSTKENNESKSGLKI